MSTLEPIAGELLSVSDKARRVMQAAAAKRRPRSMPVSRTAKPALSLTEQIYRANVRRELLAGGNPWLLSHSFIEELRQGDKELSRALDAWEARFGSRWGRW
jgi:hypothetical protein